MDYKKILLIIFGIVGIITFGGLILSNNWIGLGILSIIIIILVVIFRNELNEDLVEMEKKEIINSAKSNPHKFTEIYCISNSEIETNSKRKLGKITGHLLYGDTKDHIFIVNSGFMNKIEKLVLVPKEFIYNPSKKPLSGKVYILSSGLVNTGIFEVPDSVNSKYIAQANVSFSRQIDFRGMIQVQRSTMKLIKMASGTDGNFIKKIAIDKQQEFNPRE